jgi:hypothetical protein
MWGAVEVSIKRHSLPALAKRTTQSDQDDPPIVPRTAMRSFIGPVLLLTHFFLVLARAVPVSKMLSAKGSHPHPLVAFFSRNQRAFSPLEAALVNPKEHWQGFIPRM